MSDLHRGETMTEAFKFTSAGNAHTFIFDFPPDKVVFNNLTEWTATAGKIPRSVWFKNSTTAGYAYQEKVIEDSGSANIFNFLQATSNGFTVANTTGGPLNDNCTISGITAADPGVITHSAFTFQTNQVVRITDLGNCGQVQHGMDQLNNNRYTVVVLSPTTCSLTDVITGEPIDTTNFVTYVSGGRMCLESNVLTLNNPQVYPYSALNPYDPNPYQYAPIQYELTAGTSVMGSNGDVYLVEVYKWGQFTNLGQLA